MATEALETDYAGTFGVLCERVPLFDASAPDGWQLAYRGYDLTAWYHPSDDVEIACKKHSDGWNIRIRDHQTGAYYRTLPTNATRWNAFEAVRAFFDGEPLMADSAEGGLISLSDFRDE